MKPIYFTIGALLACATVTGSAEAKGPKGSSGSSVQPRQIYPPKIVTQTFVQTQTIQTIRTIQKNIGQSQKGQNGCWWNRCCWFPQHRCCGYFCPADGCWYYYCGSMRCYLPVNYMNTCPPDANGQNSGDNNSNGSNDNDDDDDHDDNKSDASSLPPGAVNMPANSSQRPAR